jgi:Skp family chaperone for outer membrane proteins
MTIKQTFALALAIVLLAADPAKAQQQQTMSNDDLMSIIQTLEGQRSQAQTAHAMAEARAAKLEKENAKLKAELEQLKKPPEGSK